MGNPAYRLLASHSRQRGLAAIGLELDNPAAIELEPVATGATVSARTSGATARRSASSRSRCSRPRS